MTEPLATEHPEHVCDAECQEDGYCPHQDDGDLGDDFTFSPDLEDN